MIAVPGASSLAAIRPRCITIRRITTRVSASSPCIMSDSRPPFANRLQFVSEARLQTLAQAAGRQDLQVLWVDLAGCRDKTELLARMADALAFPAHFGHDWDALADCLHDLALLPQGSGTLPPDRSPLFEL